MATLYYVPQGDHDFDDASATGLRIIIYDNKVPDPPEPLQDAEADIDTSGIPDTDVISAGDLIYEIYAVTKTKFWTDCYLAVYLEGEVVDVYYNPTTGTKTINLTSTELGYINKTGDTQINYSAGDADVGQVISVQIKAYETAQANATRLSLTHAAPVTGRKHLLAMMGVGS
jgi:hypothetical protein